MCQFHVHTFIVIIISPPPPHANELESCETCIRNHFPCCPNKEGRKEVKPHYSHIRSNTNNYNNVIYVVNYNLNVLSVMDLWLSASRGRWNRQPPDHLQLRPLIAVPYDPLTCNASGRVLAPWPMLITRALLLLDFLSPSPTVFCCSCLIFVGSS